MKLTLPVRCHIRDEFVVNDIRALEIRAGDGGFYLLQYTNVDDEFAKWDGWDDDLDELLGDCRRLWGVEDSDWRSVGVDHKQRSVPESRGGGEIRITRTN